MQTIADIVKRINALTLEEMEEIINIISKILVEKKRQLYFEQYQQALADSNEGKLFSSSNYEEISTWLNSK